MRRAANAGASSLRIRAWPSASVAASPIGPPSTAEPEIRAARSGLGVGAAQPGVGQQLAGQRVARHQPRRVARGGADGAQRGGGAQLRVQRADGQDVGAGERELRGGHGVSFSRRRRRHGPQARPSRRNTEGRAAASTGQQRAGRDHQREHDPGGGLGEEHAAPDRRHHAQRAAERGVGPARVEHGGALGGPGPADHEDQRSGGEQRAEERQPDRRAHQRVLHQEEPGAVQQEGAAEADGDRGERGRADHVEAAAPGEPERDPGEREHRAPGQRGQLGRAEPRGDLVADERRDGAEQDLGAARSGRGRRPGGRRWACPRR